MIFLPPKQNNKKNSLRKTLHRRHNSIGPRSRMDGIMKNPLGTSQGVSTLKIVLMYSVLGIILNWVLPIAIQKVNPEMLKEDAQYYGTLYAIVATFFFLVVSLLKEIIMRHRSQSDHLETQGTNTHLFGTKNSKK